MSSKEQATCVVCLEKITVSREIRVPGASDGFYHSYCLVDHFLAATEPRGIFPASYDGAVIPLDLVRKFLYPHQILAYQTKQRSQFGSDSIFCYNDKCSGYLGIQSDQKIGLYCPHCSLPTCQGCKAMWHGMEKECELQLPDDDMVAVQLMKDFGWMDCPRCRAVIQRIEGCNHRVCRCGRSFCYRCGSKGGKCQCG